MKDSMKEYAPQIARLNKLGATIWYGAVALIQNFEPLRQKDGTPLGGTKVKDLNRFSLQFDGGTGFDAEILENGRLKVIWNGCKRDRFLEDAAFNNKTFDKGKVVTFHQIERQLKIYARLANGRCKNKTWRGKRVTYNPVTHQIRVRVAKDIKHHV